MAGWAWLISGGYMSAASFRLQQGPVRTMAAIGALIVVWYLLGQLAGAGQAASH